MFIIYVQVYKMFFLLPTTLEIRELYIYIHSKNFTIGVGAGIHGKPVVWNLKIDSYIFNIQMRRIDARDKRNLLTFTNFLKRWPL